MPTFTLAEGRAFPKSKMVKADLLLMLDLLEAEYKELCQKKREKNKRRRLNKKSAIETALT